MNLYQQIQHAKAMLANIQKLAGEGCSVCGTTPAWCMDPDDKATYFLCEGCVWERMDEYRRLLELLDDMAEACPNCDNVGYTIGQTTRMVCCNQPTDSGDCCDNPIPEPEPYQEQCEFCYETKTSRFNIDIIKAQAITGKNREEAIKMVEDHILEYEAG